MLSALVVRIGADLSGLDRGLAKADRDVERFGKKIQPLGRSLARVGNSASAAAGSLARIGGVLPGVVGKTGALVATLGSASVLLGETTVLTAGLTKAWRLLGAASTVIAASSAPAWLASLATPAGLAVAGVVALTGAVAGLTFAWKKLTEVRKEHSPVRTFELIDPRVMKASAMTGQRAHTLDSVVASATELSSAAIEINLAQNAVEAWGDALEGIRPVTDALVNQWSFARDLITSALRDTSKLTADATTQLYRMLTALKAVASASAPLSRSEAAGMVNMPGVPSKGPRHALDPRAFLGSRMDFAPSPMGGSFVRDVKKSGVIQAGSGAGGEMVQAIASFGALGLILPVVTGFFQTLAPVLEPLTQILELLGQTVRVALQPVITAVVTALSYLAEALGWVIRGIGRLIDSIPGISARGLINTGQAMIDAARAARRNTNATERATEAVNEFASALSNVPRVLNVNALRHLVGAGSSPHPPGPPPVGPGPTVGPGPNSPTINIVVNETSDPQATAVAVGRELERLMSRGGGSYLQLALQ